MGGPDGKIFGSRSWRTDRAQRGPCAMTESEIFSHLARPNLVNKYFIIRPIWRQICLKFEHARPSAFVVGPYGFFQPRSRKCVRFSYGTFINGFAKKALAEPYGSYDNKVYVVVVSVYELYIPNPEFFTYRRMRKVTLILRSC